MRRSAVAIAVMTGVVLMAGCKSSGTGASSSATAVTGTSGSTGTTAPVSTAATAGGSGAQPHDKHFTLVGAQVKQDFASDFSGTAQVRNTGTKAYTAIIKFTFMQAGQVVGSADGSANEVAAGQTVTVDLVSTDKYDGRPVTYAFQVSTEF